MINILILKNHQDIISIEVSGHSGYAESGSDIVCSAVSTLMQSLANGLIEVLKISPKVIIDEDIPLMVVNISEDVCPNLTAEDKIHAQILMQTTRLGLIAVADEYKEYIKIKENRYD